MPLLRFTKKGIYCEQADVYIDPWRSVKRALITHGHSDHARRGHGYYLATKTAAPVIQYRLGNGIQMETVEYGEVKTINGVKISFHPAGHIIGSAQIRLEYKGEIWVASGDYKLENDGISEAFEPVKCHSYITESTFGLPIYRWTPQAEVFEDINEWWKDNREEGKVSIITAYSLGKAQRLIHNLDHSIGKIYTHGSIENVNKVIRNQGIDLAETTLVTNYLNSKDFDGEMVIAPPSALQTTWVNKFRDVRVAAASGWMATRAARRSRGMDRSFVLSDHADWDGLNQAVKASGAERVFVTHGSSEIFSRWLVDQGYDAKVVETEYEGEEG